MNTGRYTGPSEEWQGAMLTKSGTHFSQLGEDRGKPLVYIDFLEVAPWNWTIPGIGQYVSFMDTEGNRVSMLQPLPRQP